MRSLSFLTLIILLVTSVGCSTSSVGTPTAADVSPSLKQFLESFTRDGVRSFHNGMTNPSAIGGMVKTGMPVCYVLKTEERFFCFKAGISKTMDDMAEKMRTAIQSKTSRNGRMTRAQLNEVQREMSTAMQQMKKPTEAEIRSMVKDSLPRRSCRVNVPVANHAKNPLAHG